MQYCSGFCHTFTWISHGCTCVPHPELPTLLPPHPIPLGHPSAPALSTLPHASNLDWRSISHMIIYMFQCYFLKSSHPRLICYYFFPSFTAAVIFYQSFIFRNWLQSYSNCILIDKEDFSRPYPGGSFSEPRE